MCGVVERNSMENNVGGRNDCIYLPPLNVCNFNPAELQYVAT